jgi:hypothetical protein
MSVTHTAENGGVGELPELAPTLQTAFYGARFLELGLERFEREGLWLLLSIHHYGWRAHRDMAAFVLSEYELEGLGEDRRVHHAEHRAMAALEELFLLLDQIWRVIGGIESHRAGGGFLAGYRKRGDDIKSEFERLQSLTEDDWRQLFALPAPDELPQLLFDRGVVDLNDLRVAREMVDDQIATAMRNMGEVSRFFVRVEDAAGMRARSVRDINNAYRHGTQVVYEDCAPADIPWRAANPEEGAGLLVGVDEVRENAREQAVNILLEAPDEEGHARLASQPRDRIWAGDLIHSMEHLSVLLHKLVVSFMLGEASGGPVVASLLLDWEQLDSLRPVAGGAGSVTGTASTDRACGLVGEHECGDELVGGCGDAHSESLSGDGSVDPFDLAWSACEQVEQD